MIIAGVLLATSILSGITESDKPSEWTIYITNDNCPDYTWGYTEEQTRQSFADIVRGHLDEMNRTDSEAEENRDRYNMAVAQEAICFVERYPERKDELIRRIKEGRIYVSPYLCNSLWAFQSFENAVRTFYHARRLEKEWGISFHVAEHIEEPSLPWGVASILAGCGIKWLSSPFYKYDSTFMNLQNPPAFIFEGPDGSQIRVAMDPWACNNSSYFQGKNLLRNPERIMDEWLPHYQQLGESYPVKVILASGTHSDISPSSGEQARGFADAIIEYNSSSGEHPKLVNSILPQFCDAIDKAEEEKPFLEVMRGCFGHSWDTWPVSIAKYVADMRSAGRIFLSAEALLTVASGKQPDIAEATRLQRERCEWLWAMLSDHAWNGTGEENKRHNAELRRGWNKELIEKSNSLIRQGWADLVTQRDGSNFVVFNPLSMARKELIRIEATSETDCEQIVEENGKSVAYFISPEILGFGLRQLDPKNTELSTKNGLRAIDWELESPYIILQ